MTPALLVRLDAALLAGMSEQDRARVVELAERSLEEWELERPVGSLIWFQLFGGRGFFNHQPPIARLTRSEFGDIYPTMRVTSINADTGTITFVEAPRFAGIDLAPEPPATKSRRPSFLPVRRLDGRPR